MKVRNHATNLKRRIGHGEGCRSHDMVCFFALGGVCKVIVLKQVWMRFAITDKPIIQSNLMAVVVVVYNVCVSSLSLGFFSLLKNPKWWPGNPSFLSSYFFITMYMYIIYYQREVNTEANYKSIGSNNTK